MDFHLVKIKHIDKVICIFTEIKVLGIIIFYKKFHPILPVVGRKKNENKEI